jgi:formiminotetrahydrofolate cyclodeaminase
MALADVLDAFASNEPVPGGGSAAALAGAVGVSLLLMVAGLSKTRTGAPEEAADLAEAAARLRPLRDTLATLIDRDAEAYAAVVKAMRLPKDTDADRQQRRAAIDTAMREAIAVPLDTMRACQQALRGAVTVDRNGNPNAATDTGSAALLLIAGLRGAALNVTVNLESVSDPAWIERVANERDELIADADADYGLVDGRRAGGATPVTAKDSTVNDKSTG